MPTPRIPLTAEFEGRIDEIRVALGVSDRTVLRIFKRGVTVTEADRLAVKVLGLTPYDVWGPTVWDAFDAVPEDTFDDIAA